MTKEQADVLCAEIMVKAIVISGNCHSFWFYLQNLSHLFQALYGKEYYQYAGDYDNIRTLVMKNAQYKVMTREAA